MNYDDDHETNWERRCSNCNHYVAEHDDHGCGGFDPDRYDATCQCTFPGD